MLTKSGGVHAWVVVDNLICDLSFFRTLYSSVFDLPYKKELIAIFGVGRGALIASPGQLQSLNLTYKAVDILPDEAATAIIKGFGELLKRPNQLS
jgi:hypothetical protein